MWAAYIITKENYVGFLLPTSSPLFPYISLSLIPGGKKIGLCITNIVLAKTWEEAPGLCCLCCSESPIKWWKTSLCCHMWFVYHKVQIVTVFRVVTEAHAGPALHLLLAPAKTGMCQRRRKETALEKACLCKKNGLCFLVFLHYPVNTSCAQKKAALLFSWSLSQHIGCNSLLCFRSLILNWWCDPLNFTRYNFGQSVWWDFEPHGPLLQWN